MSCARGVVEKQLRQQVTTSASSKDGTKAALTSAATTTATKPKKVFTARPFDSSGYLWLLFYSAVMIVLVALGWGAALGLNIVGGNHALMISGAEGAVPHQHDDDNDEFYTASTPTPTATTFKPTAMRSDVVLLGAFYATVDLVVWFYVVTMFIIIWKKFWFYYHKSWHPFLLDFCYVHNFILMVTLVSVVALAPLHFSSTSSPSSSSGTTFSATGAATKNTGPKGSINSGGGAQLIDGSEVTADANIVSSALSAYAHSSWSVTGQLLMWQRLSQAGKSGTVEGYTKRNCREVFQEGWKEAIVVLQLPSTPVTAWLIQPPNGITNLLCALDPIDLLQRGLWTGTFGAILGAVVMWSVAFILTDYDRMTSYFIHLLPPMVHVMVMAVLVSNGLPTPSYSSPAASTAAGGATGGEGVGDVTTLIFFDWWSQFQQLVLSHIYPTEGAIRVQFLSAVSSWYLPEFWYWQVRYLLLLGVMHLMAFAGFRGGEPHAWFSAGPVPPNTKVMQNAYGWLMEDPPMGKQGILFRLVILFGRGTIPTYIMFVVLQAVIHLTFASLAFLWMILGTLAVTMVCSAFQAWVSGVSLFAVTNPMAALRYSSASPLIPVMVLGAYVVGFAVLGAFNGAQLLRRRDKELLAHLTTE